MEKRKDMGRICVPEVHFGDDGIEFYEVVKWIRNNRDHPDGLYITVEDICFLDYETEVLDIINEESDNMLGYREDAWIIDEEDKLRIQNRLNIYLAEGLPDNDFRQKTESLIQSILRLLELSIKTKRYMYFQFEPHLV